MQHWSVLILSRYDAMGASSRLRNMQYVPHLKMQGADVTFVPFFNEAYLNTLYHSGKRQLFNVARSYMRRIATLAQMRHAHVACVAWIEKELFPFLPGFVEALPALFGIPYIVDYDDAIFHTYDKNRNPLIRGLLANKLDSLLRGASAVTVGNAYLEAYARAHGAKRIERIPTVVDLTRYTVDPEPTVGEIRIGWIGTPATTRYLEVLRTPLQRIAQSHKVRLVTIGAEPLIDFGIPLEQHPWSLYTEASLLSSIHIGVMPLPNNPWENGKCGYKLIQYMACGRPVIASPVGINMEIARNGWNGFLAETEQEWEDRLSQLIGNKQRREQFGRQGRGLVEDNYSLQVQSPRVVRLLEEVARRRCAV